MRKLLLLILTIAGLTLAMAPAATAAPILLPTVEPAYANGTLGGVPTAAFHGQTLTVNGSGYSAHAQVQVGIYDYYGNNLTVLGTAVADVHGTFTLTTAPLPSSFVYRGNPSDVLSAGASPSGTRYLRASLYVN